MKSTVNVKSNMILCDLDRTLFDTSRFIDRLWEFIRTTYGVDSEMEKARAADFYVWSNEWYDYHFFNHLDAIPQTPSKDEFIRAAKLSLTEDFLYEDAGSVLPICSEIVTFGNEPYQRFKLSLCPSLDDLPKRIIQIDKATFVKENYHGRVTLIDDKHLEDELPQSVQFVRLDREQQDDIIAHENHISVRSLAFVEQAIRL